MECLCSEEERQRREGGSWWRDAEEFVRCDPQWAVAATLSGGWMADGTGSGQPFVLLLKRFCSGYDLRCRPGPELFKWS